MLKERLNKFAPWQRNIIILWFGTFMTGVASGEVMPFMSLYIEQLGHFSNQQVNLFSGLAYSATFLMTAIVSPLWGRLADRVGRKPMLIRAAVGMAVIQGLTGLVGSVWQLIALRLIMGAFNGYIGNANALVAKDTPKASAGRALGIIVTGFTSGALLGPLFGGWLAGVVGFRSVFFVTSAILTLVSLLTVFAVTEKPISEADKKKKTPSSEVWQHVNTRLMVGLFITTMIVQVVTNSINPIMAQYVRELIGPQATNLTFMAGLVAAAPGITTVIFAPRFGALGDRVGTTKIIIFGFLIGIAAMIPSAFVTTVWQLFALRLFIGLTNATMNPSIQTLLTRNTPGQYTSRIFSYNQSFQALGNMVGPLLGSTVANLINYRGVFIVSAVLMLINLLSFSTITRGLRKKDA